MIPLVVMAGFLGAGKTRFLSELIPQLAARGTRVRIILNDFENASIDAARLGALDALVTPLNGECICCGSLRELLQTLYDIPADPGSVMLIEANGATETDEVLGHLTTDRKLSHFTLPLQLTVVDAGRWQKRWWHNALERAQVSTATHLFLNWTHQLNDARRVAVDASLRKTNPRAARVDAVEYAALLSDLAKTVQDESERGERAGLSFASPAPLVEGEVRRKHDHPFGSASLPLPATVDRAAFEQFVNALPEPVVRAKGLVRFSDEPGPMFVWHRVPGRRGVRLDKSWPHADALPTALFIGVGMPIDAIQRAIARLAVPRER
jgi:G3E family GTPase